MILQIIDTSTQQVPLALRSSTTPSGNTLCEAASMSVAEDLNFSNISANPPLQVEEDKARVVQLQVQE